MYSKEQIDKWLILNAAGDNNQACQTCGSITYFHDKLKLKLVEAKILVDRWDNYATEIIIHSSKKDIFIQELGIIDHPNIIWGNNIHYSDDCPVDKGLCIDNSSRANTTNARHIAVFPM